MRMNPLRSTLTQKIIINIIHQMNLFWLDGRIEDIYGMLDDEVVMYLPQCRNRIEGKKDFITALQNTREQRNVKRYDELDYKVNTSKGVSIATYCFVIDYEFNHEQHSQSGIDCLVFVNKNESWQLVRRSVIVSGETMDDASDRREHMSHLCPVRT